MDKIVKVAKLNKEYIEFTDGSILSSNVKDGYGIDFGYLAVDFTAPINHNVFTVEREVNTIRAEELLTDEFDLENLEVFYNLEAKVLTIGSRVSDGEYHFPIYKEVRNNEDTILQITLNGKIMLKIDDEFFTKKQTIAFFALDGKIQTIYSYDLLNAINEAILEE